MSTTTTSTRLVDLPRVNLLPPEIQEKVALQRTQVGLGLVVLVAVVGVALLQQGGSGAVATAKSRLAAAQQEQATLQGQLSRLSYVTTAADQKTAAEALLTQAMGTEINFADFMADLAVRTPATTWFTDISMAESVPVGSLTSPASDPAKVGTISFAGDAGSHDDVAAWLDAAAKEPGFVDPYFSTSTESLIPGTGTIPGTKPQTWVTFASSVDLSSQALTNRCAKPGVC